MSDHRRRWVSRRALLGTAAVGGIALVTIPSWRRLGSAQAPAVQPPAGQPRVSVRDFGARGDGVSDDTRAFQAAHDRLTGGGVIAVEAGTYRVSRVDVRNRFVTVQLADGAVLRKAGPGGPGARGIFTIQNLPQAHFALRGGRVDLNGEGPMGIGTPGRLRNRYAPQTIPSIKAIAGPSNAAIFALRSSHVSAADTLIENSGETAILLRNCSDTLVERCRFRNIANYGVEWSIAPAADDQGSGAMPDRSRNHVRGCTFEDIDDYGLASGNGAGVGGGGGGRQGRIADYSVTDCVFQRCQRDFNFEFGEGTWVERLELARLRSRDARQGGFGLIGVRDSIVSDYVIVNPGYAPSSALGLNWPSIYGGTLSSDFRGVLLRRVQVLDERGGKVVTGADGHIAAGTRRFRSSRAGFAAADVGTFIGIRGANPEGACYVGRILRYLSPVEVELDLPAAVGVRNAAFAYGGACREGLRLFHGTSVTLEDCRIETGVHSGLPGEPPAAAIRIEAVRDPVSLSGTVVAAPPTDGAAPIGIDLIRSSLAAPARVSGFVRNLVERD